MALSRTWYTDANLAASDNTTAVLLMKSVLWGLKAMLKGEVAGTNGPEGAPPVGSRWTCEGSSDSVTSNMSGTDLWGATFDATKIVRGIPTVAHSWIVLKSPAAAGPMYMLIDWSGATDPTCTFRFSYNAFTGGSITAAPTSTGSWLHNGDGGAGLTISVVDGTATPHRIHRVTDADGNFWFLTSKNTTGIFHALIGVQTLADTRAGDTKTRFSFFHAAFTGRGAGSLGTSSPVGFFSNGNGIGTSNTNPIVVGGRTYDDVAIALGGVVHPARGVSGVASFEGIGSTTQGFRAELNPTDSKWDFYPIWVYTQNTLAAGTRGLIPDVSAMVSGPTVGAGAPTAAAQERCVVGGIAIPFSVAPIL